MHSGVTVSHVTNEELYTGLIQMQGLEEPIPAPESHVLNLGVVERGGGSPLRGESSRFRCCQTTNHCFKIPAVH